MFLNIRRWIVLFLSVLGIQSIHAQCYPEIASFKAGEKLEYEGFYNLGFIWAKAGSVTFEVSETTYAKQKALKIKSFGTSNPKYDWIYKVRDQFEVYVSPVNLQPWKYERQTMEDGFFVHNIFYYNYDHKKIYTLSQNTDKPLEKDTFELTCMYDVLTSVYFTRTLDFDIYKVDEKIPISMLIDNEIHNLYIRYKGKETIKLPNGDTYRCHAIKPLLVKGTFFKGGERMTVWITDDANKIPVMVEAEVLIGSVKAIINHMSGIKHPMGAKVE